MPADHSESSNGFERITSEPLGSRGPSESLHRTRPAGSFVLHFAGYTAAMAADTTGRVNHQACLRCLFMLNRLFNRLRASSPVLPFFMNRTRVSSKRCGDQIIRRSTMRLSQARPSIQVRLRQRRFIAVFDSQNYERYPVNLNGFLVFELGSQGHHLAASVERETTRVD